MIKKVVVLGATGKVGVQVVHAFPQAGFNVIAVSRSSTSSSSIPPTVQQATVDYSNPESLTALFKNQDAVVEAFNPEVLSSHHKMITDAIVSSGVKHVITPDFSSDTFNSFAHELEIFELKLEAQRYLEERVLGNNLKWAAVITGPLFDWAIQAECFWVSPKNKIITVFGSGDQKVSMSKISAAVQAVATVLSQPEKVANRPAHFTDYTTSTNQLIEMVQGIEGQSKWKVVNMSLNTFFEDGKKAYAKDTEAGVKDRLNTPAYQMLGTYGVFEEGNKRGSNFGGKAEVEWEKPLDELKNDLQDLIR